MTTHFSGDAERLKKQLRKIEALAKELYLKNGGTPIMSINEMNFDTVCLDFLEK